jgi:hypothetical protein
LHIGSACSDHDLIVRQFQRAHDVGAKILINGDIFDAIGVKDKRFDLTVLHESIRGKKDLARAVVDLATELLRPFVSDIDVAGMGNHDEAWSNYNGNDLVQMLIDNLNRCGGKIKHGSFWGYIRTSFAVAGHRKRPAHKLLYLHGTGGDSPVTKGTIDFNRKGRNWVYDCLTFGHKHNLVCGVDQMADVNDSGKYVERRQLNLQTGSYYRNYKQLDAETVLDQSYAARSAHPPKPLGGLFLSMQPIIDPDSGELVVKQDFMSDIVIPRKQSRRKAA